MAGNDGSQHFDGEELNLTDEQRSAIDRITEILNDLQPGRRRAFKRYIKGLSDGEKGSEEKSGDFSETENNRRFDDAGNDHPSD